VTRGNLENGQVGPDSVVLWDTTTRTFTAAEKRFRYQVLTVVVPLINVIWAGI
jgi:hypothetical protein